MARVVVKDPMTAIIPLVVLVCLLAFGLWGVFSVAYALRDGRRQAAINAAQDLSQTLTRCGWLEDREVRLRRGKGRGKVRGSAWAQGRSARV